MRAEELTLMMRLTFLPMAGLKSCYPVTHLRSLPGLSLDPS